jgi:hypothetical protein
MKAVRPFGNTPPSPDERSWDWSEWLWYYRLLFTQMFSLSPELSCDLLLSMLVRLIVVLMLAGIVFQGQAATLSFSSKVSIYATESHLDPADPFAIEPILHEGGCEHSVHGNPARAFCEYYSISPLGGGAFAEAIGSGDRRRFSLWVYADAMSPYSDEETHSSGTTFVDAAVSGRVEGWYYITGGLGEATFQTPHIDDLAPDRSPSCQLFIDGAAIPGGCDGSFKAAFGKPFYLDFRVSMSVSSWMYTDAGEAIVHLGSVSSGQRSFPLYVVPEGSTAGSAALGLLLLAYTQFVRRRRHRPGNLLGDPPQPIRNASR